MLRHIVILRFRGDISEKRIEEIFAEVGGLRHKVKGILDFHAGPNISIEPHVMHGFNHGFWFDFEDEAARDNYVPHPEHVKVAKDLIATLEGGAEGVVVFDIKL